MTGLPQPTVKWIIVNKEGKVQYVDSFIFNEIYSNFNGTNFQVKIPYFTISNEGFYTCVAANIAGVSGKTIKVILKNSDINCKSTKIFMRQWDTLLWVCKCYIQMFFSHFSI